MKSATFNWVRTHAVLILLHVQLVCHGSRRFGLYRRLLVLCKRCYRRCVVPQIHLVAYVCACVRKAMKASLVLPMVLPMVLTIAIKATLAQYVSEQFAPTNYNSKRPRTKTKQNNSRIERARDTRQKEEQWLSGYITRQQAADTGRPHTYQQAP